MHEKPKTAGKLSPLLSNRITADCDYLREHINNSLLNMIPAPVCRIFRLSESRRYAVCSQILAKEMSPGNRFFYVVKVEELSCPANLDFGELKNRFGLTKREIEILDNVCAGLKNIEIAEKLFISEITVKKHLQHIFEKMAVTSRTALIRKTIDYHN